MNVQKKKLKLLIIVIAIVFAFFFIVPQVKGAIAYLNYSNGGIDRIRTGGEGSGPCDRWRDDSECGPYSEYCNKRIYVWGFANVGNISKNIIIQSATMYAKVEYSDGADHRVHVRDCQGTVDELANGLTTCDGIYFHTNFDIYSTFGISAGTWHTYNNVSYSINQTYYDSNESAIWRIRIQNSYCPPAYPDCVFRYETIGDANPMFVKVTYRYNNTIPSIEDLEISPSPAVSTDNLNCTFNVTDPDTYETQYLRGNITWFLKKSGGDWTKNYTQNSRNLSSGHINWSMVTSENVSTDELWLCQVEAYDNASIGPQTIRLNSSIITIGDATPPVIDQAVLNYTEVYTDEDNQIFIRVIDSGSNVETIIVEIERDSSFYRNITMISRGSNNYSTIAEDILHLYRFPKDSYNATTFYAKDSSGNWNTTKISDLEWTVLAIPGAITGGGGGGTRDETLECLTFIPNNITFTFNRPAINLNIFNNHTKSVPIIFLSRDPEDIKYKEHNARPFLSFRGDVPSAILSEDSVTVTIIVNETAFIFNETLKARLTIEADGCKDKTLQIFILQERNIFMQFVSVKSLSEFYSLMKDALLTKIFLGVRYLDLFILLTISIFALTFLGGKPKSIFMYIPKLILSIVGGFILIIIIYGVMV